MFRNIRYRSAPFSEDDEYLDVEDRGDDGVLAVLSEQEVEAIERRQRGACDGVVVLHGRKQQHEQQIQADPQKHYPLPVDLSVDPRPRPIPEQQPGNRRVGEDDERLDLEEVRIDDAVGVLTEREREALECRYVAAGGRDVVERRKQKNEQQIQNSDDEG